MDATFTVGPAVNYLLYTWKKNGVSISQFNTHYTGANTPTLTVRNTAPADIADYTCFVNSPYCGGSTSTSPAARLNMCLADFNCDSSVDFFDYLDFVDAFSANIPAADFNGDTVFDFFDYLDFVDAFSSGC